MMAQEPGQSDAESAAYTTRVGAVSAAVQPSVAEALNDPVADPATQVTLGKARVSRVGFYRRLTTEALKEEGLEVRAAIHAGALAHRGLYGYRREPGAWAGFACTKRTTPLGTKARWYASSPAVMDLS